MPSYPIRPLSHIFHDARQFLINNPARYSPDGRSYRWTGELSRPETRQRIEAESSSLASERSLADIATLYCNFHQIEEVLARLRVCQADIIGSRHLFAPNAPIVDHPTALSILRYCENFSDGYEQQEMIFAACAADDAAKSAAWPDLS
jgi:hypothetical protein